MSRWRRFLVETYATADPRSLGLFRILLGLVILTTIAGRWGDAAAHLTDEGWQPRALAFDGPVPFSIFRWFGSVGAVHAALLAGAAVALCLTVGLWTRVMQVLALLFVVSLDARNVVLENGGFVALIWLALITAFLPLGRRFSVDAWRKPIVERDEPVVSLAVVALLVQWGAIYWFNYAHKVGTTWRDGSALHFFLHQEQAVTALGVFVREHAPASLLGAATRLTPLIEATVALLLLLPFSSGLARLLAWAISACLHVGIALVLDLGPFSWVMLAGFAALIRGASWDRWSKRTPARADSARPDSAPAHSMRNVALPREAVVALVLLVQVLELSHDNRAVPSALRLTERPSWLSAAVGSLRLFQEWSLCAPDPPFEARRLVAVATRADGTTFDPLTGLAPRFEVVPGVAPRGQAWDEVHRRLPDQPEHWPGFLRFLRRRAEQQSPAQPLRSLELLALTRRIPAAREHPLPVERRSLVHWPE